MGEVGDEVVLCPGNLPLSREFVHKDLLALSPTERAPEDEYCGKWHRESNQESCCVGDATGLVLSEREFSHQVVSIGGDGRGQDLVAGVHIEDGLL